jgi:hypothetical protein
MSELGDEFARYSKAERELCDEAGPLLAAIIGGIEARAGLCITEVRVTIERASSLKGSIVANCTITRAENAADSAQSTTRSGDRLASKLT